MKKLIEKTGLGKGLVTLAVVTAVFYMTSIAGFAASGKVTGTVNIRQKASTDSEVVGSVVAGKTIDILEAVKDSSGTVWYKVSVSGGSYGYIRSDMVQTSDTIEVSKTEQTAETAQTSKPAETVPTSIGEQAAVINSDGSVRIRSGASTAHDAVTSLPNGTAITLIGEANDNAGNKWYQLTCEYNGKTVEGYVRSDLITIGAAASEGEGQETGEDQETDGEDQEGENPEGDMTDQQEPEEVQEPEEPEHNDYEVVYAEDAATGEYTYWLYDNLNGNRQRINELLGVVSAANEKIQTMQEQADTEKIVIIVLAAVVVIFIIVVTVLLLKIRNLYYEDYEEDYDDEEEPEEEPEPVKKRSKRAEKEAEEEYIPVKKKKKAAPEDYEVRTEKAPSSKKKAKEEAELYVAEKAEPAKKPAPRKAQNFLIDDDEFEFEFLNMDDKDL